MSEAMHGAAIQHVLTKTVRDSAAMLDATHGEDHSSLFKIQRPQHHYLDVIQQPPKKLKIAFSTYSTIGTPVSQDAIQAIKHTAKLLESLGHEVIEDRPAIDGMQLAKDFITTWFSQFLSCWMKSRKAIRLDRMILNWTLWHWPPSEPRPALDYIQNLNNWGQYVTQMNHFFDDYDLYLTPATATVAPKNGEVKTPAWQNQF